MPLVEWRSYSVGAIVEATIPDKNGFRKARPLIVVDDDTGTPGEYAVVAITSKFTLPLDRRFIELPWAEGGHEATRLDRPSVAKCDWVEYVQHRDVVKLWGFLGPVLTKMVIERVDELHQ
jgi:hypothetical protein